MGAHHTKDKGDLGVAKVFADLVEQGLAVLFPATEHAPFDLVAYDRGRFIRVQVKYRSSQNGSVTVRFRSMWSDRHGLHQKAMDKASVDVVAIYCPELDQCFYVDPWEHRQGVTLRLQPAANNQTKGILPADRFRRVPEEGRKERACGMPDCRTSSSTLVG